MTPQVLNKATSGVPPGAVLIDRTTPYGNPFRGPDAVARYAQHAASYYTATQLELLRGRDLVCHCAPAPCHGDVLIQLANAPRDESAEN